MQIHDPWTGTLVELESCEQREAVNDFVPVRSPGKSTWFVVEMPTGRSLSISALSEADFERVRTIIEKVPLAEAFVRTTVEHPILIPLEERHWRDNPKDFRTRLKITPEKADPGDSVGSIGKSAKDGKWHGYSHRARSSFGVGDRFFPKLTYHSDWPMEKQDRWEKEQRAKAQIIKTDGEARQSAVNFARWVS